MNPSVWNNSEAFGLLGFLCTTKKELSEKSVGLLCGYKCPVYVREEFAGCFKIKETRQLFKLHRFTTKVNRIPSLNVQYVKLWRRGATTANLLAAKNRRLRLHFTVLEKCCLVWWIKISAAKNAKIHPTFYQQLMLVVMVWGTYLLTYFGLHTTSWLLFKVLLLTMSTNLPVCWAKRGWRNLLLWLPYLHGHYWVSYHGCHFSVMQNWYLD